MSLTKAKLADYLHKKMGFPKKDCLQIVEPFLKKLYWLWRKGGGQVTWARKLFSCS